MASYFWYAPRSKPGGFAEASPFGVGMGMLGVSIMAKCQSLGTRCRFGPGKVLVTHSA